MPEICPLCDHNALQENEYQIECTVCGFVVQDQLAGSEWTSGNRDPNFATRRPAPLNSRQTARINVNDAEMNYRRYAGILARAERAAESSRITFNDLLVLYIETLDMTPEMKARLLDLLHLIDKGELTLASCRLHQQYTKEMSSDDSREFLFQSLIIFALQAIESSGSPTEAARFVREWNIPNRLLLAVKRKYSRQALRALGCAPRESRNDPILSARNRRRINLNSQLNQFRISLADILTHAEASDVERRAKQILAEKGEPVYSIHDANDFGDYSSLSPKNAVMLAYIEALYISGYENNIGKSLETVIQPVSLGVKLRIMRGNFVMAEEEE
jgi:transcription initiation factor TFIIIB Brf1 subunit/transcription initiation factor TFIIB